MDKLFSFELWRQDKGAGSSMSSGQSQPLGLAFQDRGPNIFICKECYLQGKLKYTVSQKRDKDRHTASKFHTAKTCNLVRNSSQEAILLVREHEAAKTHRTSKRSHPVAAPDERETISSSSDTEAPQAKKTRSEADREESTTLPPTNSGVINPSCAGDCANAFSDLVKKLPSMIGDIVERKLAFAFETLGKPSENSNRSHSASVTNSEFVLDLEKWMTLNSIVDVAREVPDIELFLNEEDGHSVVRCKTCWEALDTRKLSKMSVFQVSRHYSDNCTLGTGVYMNPSETELIIKGTSNKKDTQFWRNFKSKLRGHLLGSSNNSQGRQHALSVKKQKDQAEEDKLSHEIAKRLVRSAIQTIRSKAGAVHYENQVTFLELNGCQIGNRGHGRKQLSIIINAANEWINDENRKLLLTPLESTGLPPHFMGIVDKATQTRETNQAILLATISRGERVAFPVGAPCVYFVQNEDVCEENSSASVNSDVSDSGESNESDSDTSTSQDLDRVVVTGGSLAELAQLIFRTIQDELKLGEKDLLRYCGTAADGQYQPAMFANEITRLSGRSNIADSSTFQPVIWDVSHLLNLAVLDVRESKYGKPAADCLTLFIERANEFNHLMGRGKNHTLMSKVASKMKEKVSVPIPYATQRFTSSSVKQWVKIERAYSLYAATFRRIHDEDEDFPLQYRVLGADFATDLCLLLDVFQPLVEMMELAQGLQFNHWKIVSWGNRLLQMMDRKCRPLYDKHRADIEGMSFKKVRLLEGWHVIGEEYVGQEAESSRGRRRRCNKKKVYLWEERTTNDAVREVEVVSSSLRQSVANRLNKGTSACSNILAKFMDFEQLLYLLCGSRETASNGTAKPIRQCINFSGFMEAGEPEFCSFFNYVVSLPYISEVAESDELFSELILGNHSYVHVKYKNVIESLFWGHLATYGIQCLVCSKSKKPIKGQIINSIKIEENSRLQQVFKVETDVRCYDNCILDEAALIKQLYTVQPVFEEAGRAVCILLDVALNTGGGEAIAESFYGVMRSQRIMGRQKNKALQLRTKIDWCLPPISSLIERSVNEIASKYLKIAACPLASDPRTIRGYLNSGFRSAVQRRKNCVKPRLGHLV
ncbi:hypothetical protein BOX15_Mlig019669g1 [Macrostomum lignano]|uniref:Uncharacterized protein n=1 Tax=Macrostomum lignano TaxID=282301 RepID=A0A267FCQ0_9PLAT|nr:hypothetical protein BOX15_Mlig019669g1 [Macrostomum lignano]